MIENKGIGNYMVIYISGSEKSFRYDEFHDDKKPAPGTKRDQLLKTVFKHYVAPIR